MNDLDVLAARLVSHAPAGFSPPAGAVVGVARNGDLRFGTAGRRVVGPIGIAPMTADTSHDIASVTKVVATTTALIRLVSAGLVSLDDAVRDHLPRFCSGPKDTVTVHDLLLHRGGLWEWQPIYVAVAADDDRADAALRYVDELPLREAPRRNRRYSDLGFIQLGRIVAGAAGAPMNNAVRELVLEPLGLSSTRFAHPVDGPVAMSARGDAIEIEMIDSGSPYPTPFRSASFGRWRHDPIIGDVCDGNAFHAFDGVSGHAGLFSTVADLLGWGAAMSSFAERDDLWRADVAATFFEPGPDDAQALGFRRYQVASDQGPIVVLGHPGFVGCAAGFVPGSGVAIAMATNRLVTDGTPVQTETLWQTVLDAVLAPSEESP